VYVLRFDVYDYNVNTAYSNSIYTVFQKNGNPFLFLRLLCVLLTDL